MRTWFANRIPAGCPNSYKSDVPKENLTGKKHYQGLESDTIPTISKLSDMDRAYLKTIEHQHKMKKMAVAFT